MLFMFRYFNNKKVNFTLEQAMRAERGVEI